MILCRTRKASRSIWDIWHLSLLLMANFKMFLLISGAEDIYDLQQSYPVRQVPTPPTILMKDILTIDYWIEQSFLNKKNSGILSP
jgi:hypothetical protein